MEYHHSPCAADLVAQDQRSSGITSGICASDSIDRIFKARYATRSPATQAAVTPVPVGWLLCTERDLIFPSRSQTCFNPLPSSFMPTWPLVSQGTASRSTAFCWRMLSLSFCPEASPHRGSRGCPWEAHLYSRSSQYVTLEPSASDTPPAISCNILQPPRMLPECARTGSAAISSCLSKPHPRP